MSTLETINPFLPIYERYIDEASFLWVLRTVAHNQPHYYIDDILELERRIDRQLAGLMTAPDDAWPLCLDALALEEPGELFVASVVAFRCADHEKIQSVVESAELNEACLEALASALNWLKSAQCHAWLKKFFQSKNFLHKRLALMACRLRRENPGDYLATILRRQDCCEDELLFAEALKLVGDLKRQDCAEFIPKALCSDSILLRWYGLRAQLLLGERDQLEKLKPYVLESSQWQDEAIHLAFRLVSIEDGRAWIRELATQADSTRHVIKATGTLGDPHAIPWLIAQMRVPEHAKLAAEAFSLMTGVDMAHEGLIVDAPNLDVDENDDSIELDEDENLLYPSAERVAEHWRKIHPHFSSGRRYFMGDSPNREALLAIRDTLPQRTRAYAVLELALVTPSEPLLNIYSKLQ